MIVGETDQFLHEVLDVLGRPGRRCPGICIGYCTARCRRVVRREIGARARALRCVRGDVADLVHLGVSAVAGATGAADVAVREDDRQVDGRATRVRGERGALGVHRGATLGIEAGLRESPAEELAHGVDGRLGRCRRREVSHHGDTHRVLVEAAGVGACTLRSRPPARPSKTWPYLSTSTLYPTSHQPSVCAWYA